MHADPRARSWRRAGLTGVGGVGALVAAASVAWACTTHIGVLKVCNPPGSTSCVKQNYRDGTGLSGGVSVSQDGTKIQIIGNSFKSKYYSIKFQAPGVSGDCHGIGTTLGAVVLGPNWTVKRLTPAGITPGSAVLCVQNLATSTGSEIPLTVI